MQGRSLLQNDLTLAASREIVFAHRDRIGESYDRIRSAFDQRFSYVRNYYPQHGRGAYQAYRHRHPIFKELYRCEREQSLSDAQRWLFASDRPVEELYDRENDPDEINNIADDPAHAQTLEKLRQAVDNWEQELGLYSVIDEAQMVNGWYPNRVKPSTSAPVAVAISSEHHGTEHCQGTDIAAPGPLRLIVQSGTKGHRWKYPSMVRRGHSATAHSHSPTVTTTYGREPCVTDTQQAGKLTGILA